MTGDPYACPECGRTMNAAHTEVCPLRSEGLAVTREQVPGEPPKPGRCEWTMPEDAQLVAGARCVREDGHGDYDGHADHVVGAVGTPGALTLYRVNVEQRRASVETMADYRGSKKPTTDDDALTTWAQIVFVRSLRDAYADADAPGDTVADS